MVLPQIKVDLAVHWVEDDVLIKSNDKGTAIQDFVIASQERLIQYLNLVFRQAGITFMLSNKSSRKGIHYDQNGYGMLDRLNPTGPEHMSIRKDIRIRALLIMRVMEPS